MLLWFSVLGLGFLVDAVYVFWVTGVHKKSALQAGISAACLGWMSLVGLTAVIQEHSLGLPWIIGLGLGSGLATYCTRPKR